MRLSDNCVIETDAGLSQTVYGVGVGAIRMKCDVMIRFATSCGHRKDIPFQGGGSTRKHFENLENVEEG